MLTADRLRELLIYDPATGLFRWRVDRLGYRGNAYVKAGQAADHVEAAGYVVIRIDGKRYKAHRLAFLYMTGAFPPDFVDHINGHRADNRWQNLRPATRSQNGGNRGLNTRNKTGVKGVYPEGKRYRAMIQMNGKQSRLGTFDTIAEAQAAYLKAANDAFGDFARRA